MLPVVVAPLLAAEAPSLRHIGAIDAHAHVLVDHPAVGKMLDRLNLRFINITVVDPHDRGYETVEPQHKAAREVFRGTGGARHGFPLSTPRIGRSPALAAASSRNSKQPSSRARSV